MLCLRCNFIYFHLPNVYLSTAASSPKQIHCLLLYVQHLPRTTLPICLGWSWHSPHLNSSKNRFFLFCTISADVLNQICRLGDVKCLAQGNISRTHGCWWTQWLQTCNHLIITTLLTPLIKYVSCKTQDWCQSRSSCAQHLKNAKSEMKTAIVQRQTIANFTLAKVGIFI